MYPKVALGQLEQVINSVINERFKNLSFWFAIFNPFNFPVVNYIQRNLKMSLNIVDFKFFTDGINPKESILYYSFASYDVESFLKFEEETKNYPFKIIVLGQPQNYSFWYSGNYLSEYLKYELYPKQEEIKNDIYLSTKCPHISLFYLLASESFMDISNLYKVGEVCCSKLPEDVKKYLIKGIDPALGNTFIKFKDKYAVYFESNNGVNTPDFYIYYLSVLSLLVFNGSFNNTQESINNLKNSNELFKSSAIETLKFVYKRVSAKEKKNIKKAIQFLSK